MSTIIRPGAVTAKREISFLWSPGVALVELVYEPSTGQLRFAIRDSNGVRLADSYEMPGGDTEVKPLAWLQAGAHRGAIGLPSQPIACESFDALIEAARAFIHRYFDCDGQFGHVAAAYAMTTYAYEKFDALGYLRYLSEPESGKSTGTLVVGSVCYRNFGSGGAQTSAPIFRLIEALGGTLLLDEADFRDSQIGSDVAKILNTGYRKGFPVQRCSEDNSRVEFYDAFGPKILNGRQPFHDEAVETRCLTYRPISTTRPDIPLQLPPAFAAEALDIRNQALGWRMGNLERITVANERIEGLGARANQILLPLLTVVGEIGDEALRTQYREHIIAFVREGKEESVGARQDSAEASVIRAYLDITSRGETPTCQAIADTAREDDEFPFALTAKAAGRMLRDLGFRTKHERVGTVVSITDQRRLESLTARYGVEAAGTTEPEGVTEQESVTELPSQPAESVTGDGL